MIFDRSFVLRAVAVLLLAPVPAAQAESTAQGRAVFEQHGCQHCHAHVARRGATPVRDMLRQFEGDPENAAKAFRAVGKHAADARARALAEADLRSISAWLAAQAWPEEEEPAAAAEAPAAPPAAVPAASAAAAPAVAETPPAPARAAVSAVRLQRGKAGADQIVVEVAGGAPAGIDMRTADDRLVVDLAGVGLADSVPATLAADAGARIVQSVQVRREGQSVQIIVAPRSPGWTYAGVQGKSRFTIELAADKSRPQPLAKAAPAPGSAAKLVVAPAATARPAPDKTAAAAAKPAPDKTAAAAEPARRDAEAKRAAAAQAAQKAEAEQQAKREAEQQAQAKREAEQQAQAKREAQAKARKEAELAMVAPAPKADGEPQSRAAKREALAKAGPKDTKLDPCPSFPPEEQVIGTVDVARAKEIMDRIGCSQCHAYVQKKTGPPFKELIEKYKGNPACVVHRLKTNKTHKEEGVTADIGKAEFRILADYVASRAK